MKDLPFTTDTDDIGYKCATTSPGNKKQNQ